MKKLILFTLLSLLTVPVMGAEFSEPTQVENSIETSYTVKGEISWVDSDNQDGLRPYAVTMHLMDNGTEVATTKATVVNEWKYKFEDLPDTHYTVEMDNLEGYEMTSSSKTENNKKVVDFTAIHTKTNLDVEGVVIWDDDGNRDALRPDELEVRLMDGDTVVEKTVVSEATDWKCRFDELNKFDASREINYTLASDAVPGYKVSSGKMSLKYSHVTEKTTVEGTLVFDDNNNQDGTRPKEVTVLLMEGNDVVSSMSVSSMKSGFVFENVPKNRNGEPISYALDGKPCEGYTTSVYDGVVTFSHDSSSTSVRGTIRWKDNDNEKNARPDSIKVLLYRNGRYDRSQIVAGETYAFDNLPKYQNGKEIIYTIDVEGFKNYMTSIAGFDIVNNYSEIERIPNDPSVLLPPEKEEPVKEKSPVLPIVVVFGLAAAAAAFVLVKRKFFSDIDDEDED